MEMTIEEMLDCFIRLKHTIEKGENSDSTTCEVYPVLISFKKEHCMEIKEAVDSAIEIVCKYQKIQEIVTKWQNEPKMKFATNYYNMAKITEVIEDGSIH